MSIKRDLLLLSKEGVEYIAHVIPSVVSQISPNTPPEISAIFATAIKSTCVKIIDKALEYMDESADITQIDLDWRANYFEKCKIVHDDEMQTLWAKILAGEANNPGAYSKRTVNFIAEMDKNEAELFTHFCGYICDIKFDNKVVLMPLLFDVEDFLYKMSTEELNHLDNIGLIRIDETPTDITLEKPIEVSYFDECTRLKILGEDISLIPTSNIELTQTGVELYHISGCKKIDGLFDHVRKDMWKEYI